MATKDQLREQRAGTVINLTSKRQESELGQALEGVAQRSIYYYCKYGKDLFQGEAHKT